MANAKPTSKNQRQPTNVKLTKELVREILAAYYRKFTIEEIQERLARRHQVVVSNRYLHRIVNYEVDWWKNIPLWEAIDEPPMSLFRRFRNERDHRKMPRQPREFIIKRKKRIEREIRDISWLMLCHNRQTCPISNTAKKHYQQVIAEYEYYRKALDDRAPKTAKPNKPRSRKRSKRYEALSQEVPIQQVLTPEKVEERLAAGLSLEDATNPNVILTEESDDD